MSEEKNEKKALITELQVLEETARFVKAITSKYEVYSNTFSTISKVLDAIAGDSFKS